MEGFLYLLIVLGSLQGIITGILLCAPRKAAYADRLLAFIIWITALPGFHLYLHYKDFFLMDGLTGWIHAIIPWMLVTALGPLIFFYTRAVQDPQFRIRLKHAIWFLPVIIDLFPKLVELLQLGSMLNSSNASVASFIDQYNRYADLPRWVVLAVCTLAAGRELQASIASGTGPVQPPVSSLRWLSQFLKVFRYFLLLWLLFLVPYLLPVSKQLLEAVGWFPVYIPMAAMIYWLGIRGYLFSRQATNMDPAGNKRKMVIEEAEMIRIIDRLTELMRGQKLYLDPALDLGTVSKVSNIPSRSISHSLNQHLGKTFNQYLNEFRVDEFKQRSADLQDLSIAGLASVCGFPSLPTFQRVFKQVTGLTPTEYLRREAS